ncbi:hypothetical protein Y1Q_0016742 [Alligator mississippiensis]|uniref:Uncharacterized protein n=1 Tax=Alligator mississippiensis TaxID=8496 RepID=A0A151P629_ALLMI|nr:hypothetical protein Y1Q_0016742 [Alligator mississippiensis]
MEKKDVQFLSKQRKILVMENLQHPWAAFFSDVILPRWAQLQIKVADELCGNSTPLRLIQSDCPCERSFACSSGCIVCICTSHESLYALHECK